MDNCRLVVDIIKEAFKKPLKFWSIVIIILLILDLSIFIYIVNFGKGDVAKSLAEINKDKSYLYSSIINTNDLASFLLIIQTLLLIRYFKKKYSGKVESLDNKQQITVGCFLSLFLFVLLIYSLEGISKFTGLYYICHMLDYNIFVNVFMASLTSYIIVAYTIFLSIFLSENLAIIVLLIICYIGAGQNINQVVCSSASIQNIIIFLKIIFIPDLYLIQQTASNDILIYPTLIQVIVYGISYITLLMAGSFLLNSYRTRMKNQNA